ncbi:hypothetical protein [Actinoplanes flavus]|uniref:Uncharacterized protein n=1 Tax=Actinoplanes flavus TaxID=2820290 RepID=A0ABS3UCW1_9ACTN|nr:hypothetical protein [Actinoplanes flavus]MBO3736610.1 hypothetical protein [Actinoplanes flavus]
MSAMPHQLLPRDVGIGLPDPVRQALNMMAAGCNRAAIMVIHAAALQVQYTTERETHIPDSVSGQAPGEGSSLSRVIVDLEMTADSCHAQSLVVLAKAAADYAIYATQVAADVIAGRQPPMPGSERIKPSDLITALSHYVPPVQFPVTESVSTEMRQQCRFVAEAYATLRNVVENQLIGEDKALYDDRAAVAANAGGTTGISAAFPEALHGYAAAVTWALGVYTDFADEGETS